MSGLSKLLENEKSGTKMSRCNKNNYKFTEVQWKKHKTYQMYKTRP